MNLQLREDSAPKLMFVITEAFGELFNAMYLVMGCRFRAVFAMREPWYSLNHTGLPGKTYGFNNFVDLLAAIDEESPDLVCLFSGYLYVKDQIIDFKHLDDLIKYVRSRRAKVVTSDPFLGLTARLPVVDLQHPLGQVVSLPMRFIGEALFGPMFTYFLRTRAILKDVPHVYVVDPDEQGVIAVAFYNPNLQHCLAEPEASGVAPAASAENIPTQPYWLFILAGSDYHPQVKQLGADRVHAQLARMLRETLDEGRGAALIAPAPCIEALSNDPNVEGSHLVSNCDYGRFMTFLLKAEYAFYWNIFSASIIARLVNNLPTFFFAIGHIADANQQMFEKGMSRYYHNASITYLDPTERLTVEALLEPARAQQRQLFEPFLGNIRALPTPEVLVRRLLNEC